MIPADEETNRIVTAATEIAGSRENAVEWYRHQPIPGWAGKTTDDLVREGKSDKVMAYAYLEEVRSGGYA